MQNFCWPTLLREPSLSRICAVRPLGFHYTGVVADFFVLREIESSLMLFSSVSVDVWKQVVKVLLPVSKTDRPRCARLRAIMGLRLQSGW